MGWKEFFKPTGSKVLLALFIFVLIPVTPHLVRCVCKMGEGCNCPFTGYTSFLAVAISGFKDVELSSAFLVTLLGLVIAYIVSSFIVYFFSNIPLESKESFKENLRLSKGRIIISVLGWLTLGVILMHYLSGAYGGTSGFPPGIGSLYGIFEAVGAVLFPFTFVTYVFFYTITMISGLLGDLLIKIPLNITSGAGDNPEGLTGHGVVVVIVLSFIGWYFFSCLVMHLVDKFRSKRLL